MNDSENQDKREIQKLVYYLTKTNKWMENNYIKKIK